MADESELKDQIAALTRKLEVLEQAVSTLATPYGQIVDLVQGYREATDDYARLVQLESQGGVAAVSAPDVKDPVSRELVAILWQGEENITRLTDGVREKLGKADRKTVRKRLAGLVERGYIEKDESGRYPTYRITPLIRGRWERALKGGSSTD